MALWFVRGLARRVVTTRYPTVIDAWAAALPTPPTFIASRLDADVVRRLIDQCPSHALWQEERSLVFDVGACTACGVCRRVAPDAVTPSGVFELSADSPTQLLKRIELQGGES